MACLTPITFFCALSVGTVAIHIIPRFNAQNLMSDGSAHIYLNREKRQNPYENIPIQLLQNCARKRSFDDVLLVGTNLSSLAAMLDPCPCTNDQAFFDYERYEQQADKLQCYISTKPLEVNVITSRINLTQQCCYNIQGTLEDSVTSSSDGYIGTFLLFHPHFNKVDYELRDKSFRDDCCEVGFDRLCNKFLEKRVIRNCEGYASPPDLDQRIKMKLCVDSVNAFSVVYIGTNSSELAGNLLPCPCSRSQAVEDHRYIEQNDTTETCFVSANPITMSLPLIAITLTQQCCYNGSGIILSSGKTAGTMLLHHPHNDNDNYQLFEKSLKERCCEINSDEHCGIFYSQRIANNCDGYLTPAELELQQQVEQCIHASRLDQLYYFGLESSQFNQFLDPCPCTRAQAETDIGRFQQQNDLPQCYVSTKLIELRSLLAELTLAQQCCYNANGALILTSIRGGEFAGTILYFHPHYDTENYNGNDKFFRSKCCDIGSDEHCNVYFNVRQTNNCAGYQLPHSASFSFGPHYQTFDGRYYDFLGNGDFIVTELNAPSGELSFTLQNRGEVLPVISTWQTFHTACAFGEPELTFQFGPGFRFRQTKPILKDLIVQLSDGGTIDIFAKAKLSRIGNTITVAFYRSGVVVFIQSHNFNNQAFLVSCEMKAPQSYSGRARGLWGNFDGDSTNDFYLRRPSNGLVQVSNDLTDSERYQILLSWHVSSQESLFV